MKGQIKMETTIKVQTTNGTVEIKGTIVGVNYGGKNAKVASSNGIVWVVPVSECK